MVFGTTLLLLAKHYSFRDVYVCVCVCVGLELKRNGMRHKHQSQEIRIGKTTTIIRNLKYTFKL